MLELPMNTQFLATLFENPSVFVGEFLTIPLGSVAIAYALVWRFTTDEHKTSNGFSKRNLIGILVTDLASAVIRVIAIITFAGESAYKPSADSGAMGIYYLVIPAIVAYAYLKLRANRELTVPNNSASPSANVATLSEADEDALFAQVAKEINSKNIDEALWTKAFSIENGDAHKTKAHYIRLRVERLRKDAGNSHGVDCKVQAVSDDNVESISKRLQQAPNFLFAALFISVFFVLSKQYGFSITALARAFGVCVIPGVIVLIWNLNTSKPQWLRYSAISVSILFGAILIASQLQKSKENNKSAMHEAAIEQKIEKGELSAPTKESGETGKLTWSGNYLDQFDSVDVIEKMARQHESRLNDPKAWGVVTAWQHELMRDSNKSANVALYEAVEDFLSALKFNNGKCLPSIFVVTVEQERFDPRFPAGMAGLSPSCD
jgi:hypothetical protein